MAFDPPAKLHSPAATEASCGLALGGVAVASTVARSVEFSAVIHTLLIDTAPLDESTRFTIPSTAATRGPVDETALLIAARLTLLTVAVPDVSAYGGSNAIDTAGPSHSIEESTTLT